MFRYLDPRLHATLRERQVQGDGCGDGSVELPLVTVIYASYTGNTKTEAESLGRFLEASGVCKVDVLNLSDLQFDIDLPSKRFVVFLVSTYEGGEPVPSCKQFFVDLGEAVFDFRYDKTFLQKLSFAVVGFGSIEYQSNFCRCAGELDSWLASLSARRVVPLLKVTDTDSIEGQMRGWRAAFVNALEGMKGSGLKQVETEEVGCCGGGGGKDQVGNSCGCASSLSPSGLDKSGATETVGVEKGDALSDGSSSASESDYDDEEDGDGDGSFVDVEDLRGREEEGEGGDGQIRVKEKPAMVTERHRQQLTKEGYKLIGSHSAVKLCRWTKHHLRGRGGCYKHSFYGIASLSCMEATPSLACANKCVFCWRHHKNPVGREWRWQMDPADQIVREALDKHAAMIKMLKGVPGVTPERFEAAQKVKHCALSLVGEPIMYPQINELISELHKEQISSFLVTNAQFPEAIENLRPVTQLYVSVDAPTAESLKAVDRPLFSDFWERFVRCLRALKEKRQRTVYRLTLVKQYNMSENGEDAEELRRYASLVKEGYPDLIEVKAVTFCGTSKGSDLTMKNVPWHEEVLNFCNSLVSIDADLQSEYEVACEHKHSCCVLIAKKTFKKEGQWHTWIDYDRFHSLVASGKPFSAEDYCAPTPSWAVIGSEERGFDPQDSRVYKNKAKQEKSRLLEATDLEEKLQIRK
uniref:tRNA 4-demethylwyosine synthase (AdoMet-dependent) n=1 Tax=Chromera velia CCMP2878 TaxID=1169474 RepID=A0A0G4IAT1_9ALVE|eukprot:Cvel_12533.t1-p1 / transcript=Cvel_12533.t1 / gene=Cvel_12533 / organism=Chromera_velia_CCMP2878 / gene_product=tRNA wybutosine-synthesizing protein 1 homolog, putative / transcript_product=tRNA wybutosine-synthesizing protein 1 homolog, putative / location=Cvel_scaffold823:10366-15412(-) / protein_length=693 / sequence_SO=supercontig / SO=protein_coding / is_pseudo=false